MSDMLLRKLLWLRHGCPSQNLYGDDGKMDCNSCMIDFVNDSPEKIDLIFWQIAERNARLHSVDNETLLADIKQAIVNKASL